MRMRGILVLAMAGLACGVFSGCTTVRTQSFPGKSMDDVFKGGIRGLCAESNKFIVYDADRQAGDIKILTRGFWSGHQMLSVSLTDPTGSAPTVTVMFPGVSPLPDRIVLAITNGIMAEENKEKESGSK